MLRGGTWNAGPKEKTGEGRVNEFTRSARICPRDNKTGRADSASLPFFRPSLLPSFCPLDRSESASEFIHSSGSA